MYHCHLKPDKPTSWPLICFSTQCPLLSSSFLPIALDIDSLMCRKYALIIFIGLVLRERVLNKYLFNEYIYEFSYLLSPSPLYHISSKCLPFEFIIWMPEGQIWPIWSGCILFKIFTGGKKNTYNQPEIEMKRPVVPNNYVSVCRQGSYYKKQMRSNCHWL